MNTTDYQYQLDVVNDWVKAADQKISILFAVLVGSASLSSEQLAKLFGNLAYENNLLISIVFSAWVTTIVWTLVKLMWALSPRIKNSADSLLHFGNVSSMAPKNYSKKIMKLSKKMYEEALIEQIHTNSKIATKKHGLFAESVIILLLNIAFLSVALMLIGVS